MLLLLLVGSSKLPLKKILPLMVKKDAHLR